ncbi:MAG TPA: ABC transporter substrate-binding protein [Kofleriaceae bacterium]|nr:ABC transporter substrate-binding protein [Kofleriaceae bacterium]
MIALALVLGCDGRDRRTPDDRIVVLIPNPAVNPDPRLTFNNYDTKLSVLLCPGLTSTDGENQGLAPTLNLAASIERVDDLTRDVVVKDGITFSDGKPLRAEDVAFTFQSALDDDSMPSHAPLAERFTSVKVVRARTVRFALKDKLATLLSDLSFGVVSAASADPATGRFPGGRVVCAGAYRIVELGHDRVLLERNPYYRPAPRTAEIELRLVPDQNAQALMLAGGSADLIQNTLRADLVDDIDARRRVQVTSGPSTLTSMLLFQLEHPILRDVRVRHAIAYAIDRDTIIAAKFHGRARIATGLLPPLFWAYEGDVDRYPFDPARAARLLDEAGYPDPDGPGGAPRFRLTYKTSAEQFRVAIAQIIAQQLGQVGIDVTVRAFEFGTLVADLNAGNFDLASLQTVPITEPDYLYTYFNSVRIPTGKASMHNRMRYRSARVDELTAAGRRELDPARRRAIYAEVQQILARDLPVVPLWHEDNIAVMNVDLDGYQVTPTAMFTGLAATGKR